MLSKQWTDCTYLDVSPMKEKLTDDDRRHFNQTAMEHAREVIGCDTAGWMQDLPMYSVYHTSMPDRAVL